MKGVEYTDSKIVKLRKLQRKLIWRFDLEVDVVPIREKSIHFAYRELFDGVAQMLLPGHFTEMPKELAQLRYLSENRPQLILSDNELITDNIGVSCIARNGYELETALKTMYDSISQTAPETVFYETGKISAKNCKGYWFEYKSFTITDEAYNLQFLIGSEETLLIGVFNCCIRCFDEWKPFIIKALEYTKISDNRRVL